MANDNGFASGWRLFEDGDLYSNNALFLSIDSEEKLITDYLFDKVMSITAEDLDQEPNWLEYLSDDCLERYSLSGELKIEGIDFYYKSCTLINKTLLVEKHVQLSDWPEMTKVSEQSAYLSELLYRFATSQVQNVLTGRLFELENEVVRGLKELLGDRALKFLLTFSFMWKHYFRIDANQSTINDQLLRDINYGDGNEEILNSSAEGFLDFLTEDDASYSNAPWWDKDGLMRKNHFFGEYIGNDIIAFGMIEPINSFIWDIYTAKCAIISLYFELWNIMREAYQDGIKWKKKTDYAMTALLEGNYYEEYWFYDHLNVERFLKAILKLAEATVRDCLPDTSVTKSIKIDRDLTVVKRFLPIKVTRLLLKHLDKFPEQCSHQTRLDILKEIANSPRGNSGTAFLVVTHAETLAEKVDGLKLLVAFEAKSRLKKLIKTSQDKDLIVLAIFLLDTEYFTKDQMFEKAITNFIPDSNFDFYRKLVVENRDPRKIFDLACAKKVLRLRDVVKRQVTLKKELIAASKDKLNTTVETLDRYLTEGRKSHENNKSNGNKVKNTIEALDSLDGPSMIDNEIGSRNTGKRNNSCQGEDKNDTDLVTKSVAVAFIKSLMMEDGLSEGKLVETARSYGLLPQQFLHKVNDFYFNLVNDQLVVIDDGLVQVDPFYVEVIKDELGDI